MDTKVIYFSDPVHDDFAGNNIKTIEVSEKYRYSSSDNPVYLVVETLLYLIAVPIIFLMNKIIYRVSYKNRAVLRKAGRQGYFLYGNHTNAMLDAYNPALSALPKKAHIIVNPDATSIPGIRWLVKIFGAIPVPTSRPTMANFRACIQRHVEKGRVIAIYPEAHIWPWYTGIRPFPSVSFHYPAELDRPCFAMTNTYQKSRIFRHPRVVTYFDGPFHPDMSLPKKQRVEKLRNEVYAAMQARAAAVPQQEWIHYEYRPLAEGSADVPAGERQDDRPGSC